MTAAGDFDSLPENDLDDAIAAPKDQAKIAASTLPAPFVETCPKCRGRGEFISYSGRSLGQCFACKGKGTKTFATSPAQRAANRDGAKAREVRKGESYLEAFKAEHPIVFAWFDGSTYPFAVQMRESVAKFGSLTERQLAAAYGAADKLAAAKAEAQSRVDNAKAIDLSKIEAAFAKAAASLKSPKLRVAGMVISRAKETSKNAGSLYVKSGETYLGRITGGRFVRSRDCRDEDEKALLECADDPKAASIKFGRLTGSCACCGRELTDPKSVELGIGPICADKWGF